MRVIFWGVFAFPDRWWPWWRTSYSHTSGDTALTYTFSITGGSSTFEDINLILN